eukprot:TCONS_00011380-protein
MTPKSIAMTYLLWIFIMLVKSKESFQILTTQSSCDSNQSTKIYIDPQYDQCTSQDSKTVNCPSLYAAYHSTKLFDNTCIILKNSVESYPLNVSILIHSSINFAIQSQNQTSNIDCQGKPYNISITHCSNINFKGISFTNCPSFSNEDSILTFDHSINIQLTNIIFHGNESQNILIKDCGNVGMNSLKANRIRILYQDVYASSGDIQISNSNFSSGNNQFPSEGAKAAETRYGKGGGISMFLMNDINNTLINISQCRFDGNSAIYGGGLYLYLEKGTFNNRLTLNETYFTNNNSSTSGGALYIADFSSSPDSNQIIICNSNFTNNFCDFNAGGSAIYAYNGYLKFLGNNRIEQNNGTAMVLGATESYINGNLTLANNSGKYGGAAFLYKCARFKITPTSNIVFSNNKASRDGGAMFVFHFFKKKSCKCFFAPQNRTSFTGSINFTYNTAAVYGRHLYSSTMKLCQQLNFNDTHKERIFFTGEPLNAVSTAADKFTLVSSQWRNIVPGFYFKPEINITNEKDQIVKSQVQMIRKIRNTSEDLDNSTNGFGLLNKNTYVVGPDHTINVALQGQSSQNYTLDFYVSSELGELTQNLTVKLSKCPPLYYLHQNKCKCNASGFIAKCTSDNALHMLPNCWISPQGNSYACPVDYCAICSEQSKLSTIQKYCTHNFTQPCDVTRNQASRLCSQCRKNHSTTIGGRQCADCRGTNNHYWTPILAIVIVSLFLLFIAASNYTTYASFYLPLILFYQLVTLVMTTTNSLGNFSVFLFTIFHGDDRFMYPFCFIDGLDDLHKIWVRFISAALWVILYGVLCFISARVFQNQMNLKLAVLRSWPIVFLLYYIDIMKFSVNALKGMTIDDRMCVFNYAEEEFNGQRHRPLFWCSIITTSCTGLMMLGIFMLKVYCKRNQTIHEYVHIEAKSLDSIVSRRKIILIFGFYTLYVTLFTLIMELTGTNALLLILSITFTGIFVYKQPYQSKLYNYYEILVYVDFMIIGILSNNPDNEHSAMDNYTSTFVEVLIVFPFVGCLVCMLITYFGTWKSNQQNLGNTRSHLIPSRVMESL